MDKSVFVIIGINLAGLNTSCVIDTWGYFTNYNNALACLKRYQANPNNANYSFVIKDVNCRDGE